MTWHYYNPVRIVFNDKFIEVLKNEIDPSDQLLLICEKRLLETPEFMTIESCFNKMKIITEIEANPSFLSVDKAIALAKDIQPKVILAIGGGSVIDTAKIIRKALIIGLNRVSEIVKTNKKMENIGPTFIVIPTTHGTSSELTKWATVWDKENKKKYSVSDDANYPALAIYDYHFVETLPLGISRSTTLDALSHSFEALWNKNANPISDHYAEKAIVKILIAFDGLKDPIETKTRKALLEACVYAGLAFSNTKTAAAHSISYPLTAYFGLQHGIACSFTLSALLNLVKYQISSKIDVIVGLAKYKDSNELMDKLKDISTIKLSDYGITESDINMIVHESNTKGRMDNFIYQLNEDEIKYILSKSL